MYRMSVSNRVYALPRVLVDGVLRRSVGLEEVSYTVANCIASKYDMFELNLLDRAVVLMV